MLLQYPIVLNIRTNNIFHISDNSPGYDDHLYRLLGHHIYFIDNLTSIKNIIEFLDHRG